MELSFTRNTRGMEMLLNMVTANQHKLGYSPPENVKMLAADVPDFTCESVLRQEANGRGSLILLGSMNSQQVILKASINLNNELKMLKILEDCQNVP